MLIIHRAHIQEVLDIYLVLVHGVFTQGLKTGPHAYFHNYSMICASLPPLPQLALTACFDLFSFCRPAYFTSSPDPVVSPSFALARDFSGLLFLAAADSFPTLVFCCGEGNERMMGRISVWVWACVYICACEHT